MREEKIKVFYNISQVSTGKKIIERTSRSPLKPLLLMKALDGLGGFNKYLDIESGFKPFSKSDFQIAHTKKYVDEFFLNTLCGAEIKYEAEVAPSENYFRGKGEKWVDGMPASLIKMLNK